MKNMASDSIASCQIKGETMETVREFIFLGYKITADGDCSHAIKTCLLLRRKAITNIDSLLCSLFLLLLHQLHLRSPGIRSWRLGTPAWCHSSTAQLCSSVWDCALHYKEDLLLSLELPVHTVPGSEGTHPWEILMTSGRALSASLGPRKQKETKEMLSPPTGWKTGKAKMRSLGRLKSKAFPFLGLQTLQSLLGPP